MTVDRVTVDRVTKRHGQTVAVDDVSFEAFRGRVRDVVFSAPATKAGGPASRRRHRAHAQGFASA